MKRIKEEQRVVEQMVCLYCKKKEGNNELCPGCQELLQYATARLERCKFGENKPTCKKCPIHCYRPQMKERMREVMRWAGPKGLIGRGPMMGMYWDNPEVTAPERCRTDACLVVPAGTAVDAPVAL